MSPPHGADLVVPGQERIGIIGHVGHGKIVLQERLRKAGVRQKQEYKKPRGQGPGAVLQREIPADHPRHGHHGQKYREHQRKDKREVSQLWNHASPKSDLGPSPRRRG